MKKNNIYIILGALALFFVSRKKENISPDIEDVSENINETDTNLNTDTYSTSSTSGSSLSTLSTVVNRAPSVSTKENTNVRADLLGLKPLTIEANIKPRIVTSKVLAREVKHVKHGLPTDKDKEPIKLEPIEARIAPNLVTTTSLKL